MAAVISYIVMCRFSLACKKFVIVKKFLLPLGDFVKMRRVEGVRKCNGGFHITIHVSLQQPKYNLETIQ